MAKIEIIQKRDIGRLITDTFGFIRQEGMSLYKKLFKIGFPIIIIMSIIETLAYINGGEFTLYIFNDSIVVAIFNAYVLTYMRLYRDNEGQTDLDEVWKESKSIMFIMFIKVFAIRTMILAGALILVIPGIFFAVALSLVLPLTVFEEEYRGGYKRSFKLIRGNFFFALGAWAIMQVLVYSIYLLLALPYINAYFNMANPAFILIANAISNLDIFISVVPIVFSAFLYHHIMLVREDPELMDRIDQLDSPTTDLLNN